MAGHDLPPTHEEEIHLPTPTLAPATIGLGITLIAFGILWPPIPLIVGGLFFVVGLAVWLINDAREFVAAGDHEGHGGH